MTYTNNGKIKVAVITTANSHHIFQVIYSCSTLSCRDLVKGKCDIHIANACDLEVAKYVRPPSLYQEYLQRVIPRDSFYFQPGDERR